jgi:hypothetical protein
MRNLKPKRIKSYMQGAIDSWKFEKIGREINKSRKE